jgi:rSAM/selenodomain-associated transferase 2
LNYPKPKISIVIPTFNEAQNIKALGAWLKADGLQVIVADGGSTDATQAMAQTQHFEWVACPQKGRAAQLNYGAQKAKAPILFFMHADSRPPKDFATLIQNVVNKKYQAGCFRLQFDWSHPLLKFSAWLTRFNLNAFRFGDQGFFVSQKIWQKLGGYNQELLLLEDQDIAIRAKKLGRFKIISKPMLTSARKYRVNGAWRLQWIFFNIWWRAQKGQNQTKLLAYYRQKIKDDKQ